MATNNTSSSALTNETATPIVKSNPGEGSRGQMLKSSQGYVANNADDSSGSIQRFCRVPSNALIRSVKFSTADATTAGAINLGLYDTEGNGGAVVDADLFVSALDLTGGPFSKAEQIDESGEFTYAEQMTPLWEVLGLSADPHKEYDVASTISTTFNGAGVGQIVEVQYVTP